MKTIARLAWGFLALSNLALLFGMQKLPMGLQLLLGGLSFLALIWLLFRYNRELAQWRVVILIWLAYCVLRLLAVHLYANEHPFLRENLAGGVMIFALEAILSGWFAALVLAIRRDVSLAYLVIFFALGAPLIRGLVIEAGGVLSFLAGPSGDPLEHFSIAEPIIMSLTCMGTLGFVTFVPHLIRLLIRELRR